MTDIALVTLEGTHQVWMTAGDHPMRPLVISHQPPENLCLELG